MFYAVLNNKVIDIQEELQEYGPDVFGNPVIVIESNVKNMPLGTIYDSEKQEFVIESIPFIANSGSADDVEKSLENSEETLDNIVETDYNSDNDINE